MITNASPRTLFNLTLLIVLVVPLTFLTSCSSTKSATQDRDRPTQTSQTSDGDLKPYSEVITSDAVTDEGLFDIHSIDGKLFYEIPDSLLERELLLVSRIAETPTNFFGFFSGGSKVGEQVITFQRKRNQILLRKKSYSSVAADSLPINRSVEANNFEPILASFDIESVNPDSTSIVVEVTDFYTDDVPAISGLVDFLRGIYQVRRLDSNRSYIDSAKSFPRNIEVRHALTYIASNPPSDQQTHTISLMMNQSMILLPDEPMQPRFADHRVGWFTLRKIDFGLDEQKAAAVELIRRWRLEPEDPEAYANGKLVEPVKPIVFYLDPATPEKYRPYIKKGVEDWQVAFEAAGFKNAIQAKEPPLKEENPDFSPEDIRYSTIRYVANTVRNAVGPSVTDPRSGEIIESDIIWYHNHLRSYRNRLMIETGAANPEARSLKLDDDLIGETMRQVIAHEVGHALGLPHNMQASSAYPVDSLRSGRFTQRMGIAPTIMDYARQNYIAQPGDENIRFIRQIGPYDKYAINWGYRVIPEADTPEEEKPVLDSWIMEKAGDPIYRFGSAWGFDPSIQTEDLSDNPVKASTYGMKNLQRVVPNLIDWTSTPGEGYDDLEEIYGELVSQWNRYVNHVITNIGGIYSERKATNQEGPVYTRVPASTQRNSMTFLVDHAFTTPSWLLNEEILNRIEHTGAVNRVQTMQERYLGRILDNDRMLRIIEGETFDGENAYTLAEMLETVREGIWAEIYSGEQADTYRRNLQRTYLEIFQSKLDNSSGGNAMEEVRSSDIQPLLKAELRQLRADLRNADGQISGRMMNSHIEDAVGRINHLLDNEE